MLPPPPPAGGPTPGVPPPPKRCGEECKTTVVFELQLWIVTNFTLIVVAVLYKI
jgi:hypothetical protein